MIYSGGVGWGWGVAIRDRLDFGIRRPRFDSTVEQRRRKVFGVARTRVDSSRAKFFCRLDALFRPLWR